MDLAGDREKAQTVFMRAFCATAIIVLLFMMVYGPTTTGTTQYNQCVEYRYDYRGQRSCARYEPRDMNAKYNLLWYLFVPMVAGIITGWAIKCTNYPAVCAAESTARTVNRFGAPMGAPMNAPMNTGRPSFNISF